MLRYTCEMFLVGYLEHWVVKVTAEELIRLVEYPISYTLYIQRPKQRKLYPGKRHITTSRVKPTESWIHSKHMRQLIWR